MLFRCCCMHYLTAWIMIW